MRHRLPFSSAGPLSWLSGEVVQITLCATRRVNRLEEKPGSARPGLWRPSLPHLDLVVLDELGYLPSARSGSQLLFHLISNTHLLIDVSSSLSVTRALHTGNGHRPARHATFPVVTNKRVVIRAAARNR